MADVLWVLLCLANQTGVDLTEELQKSIDKKTKRDAKRHLYWIITSNSIAYMTEDFRVVTIKNFPYSNNCDMVENSKGEMWILASMR